MNLPQMIAFIALVPVSLYALPPQTEAASTAASEQAHIVSFGQDTVGQSDDKIGTSGNWVKKKDYLMRSFDVQKEIDELATQVEGNRAIYQQKFNMIDDQLSAFYQQLGLEEGKVEELLTSLTDYISKKKQRRIERLKQDIVEVREQQLAIEQLDESIKLQQEELAQLKLDMKSIIDLDQSVNVRMQRADDQIRSAQNDAVRAKEIVQSMWDLIDDRRAKAAYFDLKDGILRHVQSINTYLQGDLLRDLDTVSATITAQIGKAKAGIKSLEEKGFIISDRSKRLEEHTLKKAKEAEERRIAQMQKEIRRMKKAADDGFFTRLYNRFVTFIADVYNFFANLFGSKKPVRKIHAVTPPTTPAEKAPQTQTTQQAAAPVTVPPIASATPVVAPAQPQPLAPTTPMMPVAAAPNSIPLLPVS
jgi:hypothetical protein